ncbi:hypothetical protein LTR27_011750 [Elasticomyces elasticus]|nr:hypothetical protein LTR27_011750 [Elasticomyces elasticus]
MSANQSYEARTIKGKRRSANPPSPSISAGPTTFFLRSERDMDKSTQRGRKASRSSQDERPRTPSSTAVADSRFGVESLSDTLSSAFPSEASLSRTNSNSTEAGAVESSLDGGTLARRKRKAGNPVHPNILATGQRIISAERLPASAASPLSYRSSESPYRSNLRRGSATSSLNLNSQPLTPLRMSPQPESAMPSTPRTGSPKSFRLSDEESSVVDETGSQAIHSSSEEDEDIHARGSQDSSMPQLVMPSISVSARRPFTERGKRMGRLKVMVVGNKGVGKTSLIQSIFRVCEDVVHVDAPGGGSQGSLPRKGTDCKQSPGVTEFHASTRPYPPWWTDSEGRRMLHRRRSVGEGVLERNLCFIDTPAVDDEYGAQQILDYFNDSLQRTANLDKMSESELISVVSGEGGNQIDVVLWILAPQPEERLVGKAKELFMSLSNCTNVLPIIGHADTVSSEEMSARKLEVLKDLEDINGGPEGDLLRRAAGQPSTPLSISSALSDDAETIDASILMSSQYVQPLIPSELSDLIDLLLDDAARIRHLSAVKFLTWRQRNLGAHIDERDIREQRSPLFGHTLPSVTDTGSMLEDPSKVLVPYGSSSYFRSVSPSAVSESPSVGAGATATSTYALAHYNEQTQSPDSVPFRQVRLAKWARDLQRGLENERRKYQTRWHANADANTEEGNNNSSEKCIAPLHNTASSGPSRGRLGGAIAVIDPRDPLGILSFAQAFRRQGWFVARVASGCGLVGAIAWWVVRNWAEVQQKWLAVSEAPGMRNMVAVPPPSGPERGLIGWVEEVDWKGFFGWEG